MRENKNADNRAIGQRIRAEREKLGLSRQEFAEILRLSDYYVGQLERGERQMSLPVLVEISNCLHVSLDYIIFGKSADDICYVKENVHDTYRPYTDIGDILKKCSSEELELILKLIKTILPYLRKG